jgi:hypothetical protein
MSSSVVYQLTTAGTTNLTRIGTAGSLGANVKGLVVTNTAAYAIFVKLYWDKGLGIPTVGTTVPALTVTCPAAATSGGGTNLSFPDGITGNGQLWMWVTKLAAATDATVTVSGDGIIAVLVE